MESAMEEYLNVNKSREELKKAYTALEKYRNKKFFYNSNFS
jgi:hypothetical protein